MTKSTPIIRAGDLLVEALDSDDDVRIAAESDDWFAWLETAQSFAFEDPIGRFSARKRRRWGREYWYAFRRLGGRLYETYLGKARNVTLGRLNTAARKLNDLAGWTSPSQPPQQVMQVTVVPLEDGYGHDDTRNAVGKHSSERSSEMPAPKLTPRQRQVLRLIASGESNNDIAEQLVISPATVKRHVSNILLVLDVKNRTQAVARGRDLQLLDAEGPTAMPGGPDTSAASSPVL